MLLLQQMLPDEHVAPGQQTWIPPPHARQLPLLHA
jgi:hypothetical protein